MEEKTLLKGFNSSSVSPSVSPSPSTVLGGGSVNMSTSVVDNIRDNGNGNGKENGNVNVNGNGNGSIGIQDLRLSSPSPSPSKTRTTGRNSPPLSHVPYSSHLSPGSLSSSCSSPPWDGPNPGGQVQVLGFKSSKRAKGTVDFFSPHSIHQNIEDNYNGEENYNGNGDYRDEETIQSSKYSRSGGRSLSPAVSTIHSERNINATDPASLRMTVTRGGTAPVPVPVPVVNKKIRKVNPIIKPLKGGLTSNLFSASMLTSLDLSPSLAHSLTHSSLDGSSEITFNSSRKVHSPTTLQGTLQCDMTVPESILDQSVSVSGVRSFSSDEMKSLFCYDNQSTNNPDIVRPLSSLENNSLTRRLDKLGLGLGQGVGMGVGQGQGWNKMESRVCVRTPKIPEPLLLKQCGVGYVTDTLSPHTPQISPHTPHMGMSLLSDRVEHRGEDVLLPQGTGTLIPDYKGAQDHIPQQFNFMSSFDLPQKSVRKITEIKSGGKNLDRTKLGNSRRKDGKVQPAVAGTGTFFFPALISHSAPIVSMLM